MNPRFVILYRNREGMREAVEQWINDLASKNFPLTTKIVRSPLFETRLSWPPSSELFAYPMGIQCEEVELTEGKLVSIRKLVTDVETNTTPIEVSNG